MKLDLIQKAFARRSGDRPGRRRRRFAGVALITAGVVAATLVAVSPTQALRAGGVGPRDPGTMHFPAFYTDDSGVAVRMCLDGTFRCAGAGPRSLRPPDGEAFYWTATGNLRSPGIQLSVEFALEAAWASPKRQIVFDRLRVRGHVNTAGTYTITHPYGTVTVRAADPAEQRNVNFTQDVGCACSFKHAATSANSHITDFLVNTTRPKGFLGQGGRLGPATVGIGGPSASMSVTGPAGSASTTRFGVVGKLAPAHRVRMPHRISLANAGGVRVRTATLRNLGTQPYGVTGRTIVGTKAFRLAKSKQACKRGVVLRPGGRCTIAVKFVPNGRRVAGKLVIKDDTPGGKRTIALRAR